MVRELLKDLNCNYDVEDEDLEVVKEKLLEFMLKVLTLREYNLICLLTKIMMVKNELTRNYQNCFAILMSLYLIL